MSDLPVPLELTGIPATDLLMLVRVACSVAARVSDDDGQCVRRVARGLIRDLDMASLALVRAKDSDAALAASVAP